MTKNDSSLTDNLIRSPCVSNCCLDPEDICLGCYRHIDEITGWHSADTSRRLEIIKQTKIRRTQKETN